MTVYKCEIPETSESLFMSDIQDVKEQSPFSHVERFDKCYIDDGCEIHGKNYEGRIVHICSEDEFVVFE